MPYPQPEIIHTHSTVQKNLRMKFRDIGKDKYDNIHELLIK